MVRDSLSLIMVTAAASLPFAVQARLEAAPATPWGGTAANALVEGKATVPPSMRATGDAHHIQRSKDGMFYVTAMINGRPIRFLIDTGASIVILSRKDAELAGVANGAADYDSTVSTVAGRARVARVSIGSLSIGGQRIGDVEAAVVEEGVGVSLLGHNALARFQSLSIEGDQLTLR